MKTARDHYDEHLGPVYSWMAGDFEALRARSAQLFTRLGLVPGAKGRSAVDLGAGHGAQSVALAELGFEVISIDFCARLLHELAENAGAVPIRIVEADLREFRKHIAAPLRVAVCMGDTLPHLSSTAEVEQLVHDVAAALGDGGVFIVTFRDYVSRALEGEARFIPVRADDERIFTCFLEYGSDTVTVYDILHRKADGQWTQQVSSYRKLRIDPAWLGELCVGAGLQVVERFCEAGLVTLVASKTR
jgi:SAM-dependent methyltransferase